MTIYDFVGKQIKNPINNGSANVTQAMFGQAQNLRAKHQTLTTRDNKQQMEYTLLYYVAGLTTYCGIRGKTILTGYMSGCYLFRYRKAGELRAAHVGTDNSDPKLNTAAKAAWKSLANDPQVNDVFGFDPAKDISAKLLMDAAKAGGVPQIMGIWEGNGAMRVAVVTTANDGSMTLVGIEHAPLRPWSSIALDPKMV